MDSAREKIDRCDRELVELLARRFAAVREVHAEKCAAGLPVLDPAREQEVFSRVAKQSEALGVDPRVVEKVMEQIVEASHAVQSGPTAHPQRILVVGGQGKMGRLFVAAFERLGHDLVSVDRDDPLEPASADVVLLAVPLPNLLQVARQVLPAMRKDALLCDVGSVKGPICELYAKASCEAIGLHPLFGPVPALSGERIAVCPVRSGQRAAWLRDDFGRLGLQVIELSAETHDELMASVQILSHFCLLCFGAVLSEAGVPEATTPQFRVLLAALRRVIGQPPDLFAEIQRRNPHGQAMRERFVQIARDLVDVDCARIEQLFSKLRSLV